MFFYSPMGKTSGQWPMTYFNTLLKELNIQLAENNFFEKKIGKIKKNRIVLTSVCPKIAFFLLLNTSQNYTRVSSINITCLRQFRRFHVASSTMKL